MRSAIRPFSCLLPAALFVVALACSSNEPPAGSAPGDGDYTVRGRVVALPAPDAPGSALAIHHEHIPHFRGRDGTVHRNPDGTPGMKEMVMHFPVADRAHLRGIAVGDAVEFVMAVRWSERPPYRVTSIRKLGEGVNLGISGESGRSDPEPR